VAVVLTLVQTKQIRINIHKRNNTKTVQKTQNTVYTSTHITKTTTQLSKQTHITKPIHTHTHTHIHTPWTSLRSLCLLQQYLAQYVY
jgi:hypothetical protein